MRIYETPKCLADLEKGDIVYTIFNGEITQAKVIAFRKIFRVRGFSGKVEIANTINNSKEKWANKTSSYITFITPKGDKFTKNFNSSNQELPYIYNSLEDLRNKPKYGHTYLETNYSSRVSKDADTELAKFIGNLKRMLPNVKISEKGEICLWRSFRGKVEELDFDLVVFDSEKEGFEIGHNNCIGDNSIWGNFYDLINKKRYFTTQEECYTYTMPKVVTFEDEPIKPSKKRIMMEFEVDDEKKISEIESLASEFNPKISIQEI